MPRSIITIGNTRGSTRSRTGIGTIDGRTVRLNNSRMALV